MTSAPGPVDPWRAWAAARPAPRVVHLDSAAAGRSSTATLEATAAHARLEAELGGYVAAEQAAPAIERTRAGLAGLLGHVPDAVAFVQSASDALATLLRAWPLPLGAVVGVADGEWGPNLAAFADAGLVVRRLPVHGDGTLDLTALDRTLERDPPAVVHVTGLASHRPTVQPVPDLARLCASAGVPLWLDAAQALGHTDVAVGADAVYGTGRKWLTGPRGVGMLAVVERWWDDLVVRAPATSRATWPSDVPPVRLLESREGHVAGRVGLGQALREHSEPGPTAVRARLAEVGRATREALADLPGWEVVGPVDAPAAITALRPTAGQDVVRERARLLDEHRIVAAVAGPERAPLELHETWLRLSPHVDLTAADLDALRTALTG